MDEKAVREKAAGGKARAFPDAVTLPLGCRQAARGLVNLRGSALNFRIVFAFRNSYNNKISYEVGRGR